MKHLEELPKIAEEDVKILLEKEKNYGASWKRRGGIGAFMMLARKWDRLENQVKDAVDDIQAYDIFAHVEGDEREEGLIDDIRDLRRYLMLVESEVRARRPKKKSEPRQAPKPCNKDNSETKWDPLEGTVDESKVSICTHDWQSERGIFRCGRCQVYWPYVLLSEVQRRGIPAGHMVRGDLLIREG